MEQTINIVLRPVNSGGTRRRLGLYTKEFEQYVYGRDIRALYIDLGDGSQQIDAMKTYFYHGSITSPDVNAWLHQHGWLTANHQLLFSLEMDESRHTHIYRFVKHV